RSCTTILISHRFSTVRHVDRIAVVERGAVVEYGSHEELMGLRGRYWTMFSLQAQRFAEGTPDEREAEATFHVLTCHSRPPPRPRGAPRARGPAGPAGAPPAAPPPPPPGAPPAGGAGGAPGGPPARGPPAPPGAPPARAAGAAPAEPPDRLPPALSSMW